MQIAVDLDGVLANTMARFCTILNKRYSTHFRPDSFVRWNAWEIAQITKDEFFRTLDETWFSWNRIPPMENSMGEKVSKVRGFGATDIVTARSEETIQFARRWLRRHNIQYHKLVRTLSTLAKAELNYDVFIDDSADLMSLLTSDNGRYGILYTQPWNSNASQMPGVFRVHRWAEIPTVLREISSL